MRTGCSTGRGVPPVLLDEELELLVELDVVRKPPELLEEVLELPLREPLLELELELPPREPLVATFMEQS